MSKETFYMVSVTKPGKGEYVSCERPARSLDNVVTDPGEAERMFQSALGAIQNNCSHIPEGTTLRLIKVERVGLVNEFVFSLGDQTSISA